MVDGAPAPHLVLGLERGERLLFEPGLRVHELAGRMQSGTIDSITYDTVVEETGSSPPPIVGAASG